MSLPQQNQDGWVDAGWRLPRPETFPVEVELASGKVEYRDQISGSWLKVKRWRLAAKKALKGRSGKSP